MYNISSLSSSSEADHSAQRLANIKELIAPMQRPGDAEAFTEQDNTHLWIVNRAAELLQHEGEAGQFAYELVKPGQGRVGDAFHDHLCRGVYEPDHRAPLNDPLLPLGLCPTWKSHFYDPDTQTNWLGEKSPTAIGRATTYYHLSRETYKAGDMRVAGYSLGLSLHYMGDMTQPMHAANFTWLSSWQFGYHTAFEAYAKTMLHCIELPRRYVPLALGVMPHGYIKAVARRTKDTYFRNVCKPEWTRSYNKHEVTNKVWHQRVGLYIGSMLSDAVLMTAQYLLFWAESLLPVHSDTRQLTATGAL
ncbi:MAG TPA: zinc dependent phospholipase C family protein [Ktedonosporobacter sp.]|nr:zinc dependent phospholipase C family protein [Ktedonosporobacter sp.]